VTVATPKHAEYRPFGAARIVAGVLSGLLSLTLNFVVLLVAVFGLASYAIALASRRQPANGIVGEGCAPTRRSRAALQPRVSTQNIGSVALSLENVRGMAITRGPTSSVLVTSPRGSPLSTADEIARVADSNRAPPPDLRLRASACS
jgi:hypothetical protein